MHDVVFFPHHRKSLNHRLKAVALARCAARKEGIAAQRRKYSFANPHSNMCALNCVLAVWNLMTARALVPRALGDVRVLVDLTKLATKCPKPTQAEKQAFLDVHYKDKRKFALDPLLNVIFGLEDEILALNPDQNAAYTSWISTTFNEVSSCKRCGNIISRETGAQHSLICVPTKATVDITEEILLEAADHDEGTHRCDEDGGTSCAEQHRETSYFIESTPSVLIIEMGVNPRTKANTMWHILPEIGLHGSTYRPIWIVHHIGQKGQYGHFVCSVNDTAQGWLRADSESVVQENPTKVEYSRTSVVVGYERVSEGRREKLHGAHIGKKMLQLHPTGSLEPQTASEPIQISDTDEQQLEDRLRRINTVTHSRESQEASVETTDPMTPMHSVCSGSSAEETEEAPSEDSTSVMPVPAVSGKTMYDRVRSRQRTAQCNTAATTAAPTPSTATHSLLSRLVGKGRKPAGERRRFDRETNMHRSHNPQVGPPTRKGRLSEGGSGPTSIPRGPGRGNGRPTHRDVQDWSSSNDSGSDDVSLEFFEEY